MKYLIFISAFAFGLAQTQDAWSAKARKHLRRIDSDNTLYQPLLGSEKEPVESKHNLENHASTLDNSRTSARAPSHRPHPEQNVPQNLRHLVPPPASIKTPFADLVGSYYS